MVCGLVKSLVLWSVHPAAWSTEAVLVASVNSVGLWVAGWLIAGVEIRGRHGRLGVPVLISGVDLILRQVVVTYVQAG